MGDKAAARALAERSAVPVVPGSDGAVAPENAVAAAEHIGYPVMIKAVGGGGGTGIRVARDQAELDRGAKEAARESAAFIASSRL